MRGQLQSGGATVTGSWGIFAVALGSALGGMVRYALVVAVETRRRDPSWPLGTLAVNLIGSFLLGVLVAWSAFDAGPLRTGVVAALGSFTTVSAFVLESWQRRARPPVVLGYGACTVLGCLSMFRLGAWLA